MSPATAAGGALTAVESRLVFRRWNMPERNAQEGTPPRAPSRRLSTGSRHCTDCNRSASSAPSVTVTAVTDAKLFWAQRARARAPHILPKRRRS